MNKFVKCRNRSRSLSNKSIAEVKDYIALSKIYIGNDSFGHHVSCQMGKPSFVILLDTPRAYSDYSINQNRIIPPGTVLDKIKHDSRLDPNSISVDLVLNKIKDFKPLTNTTTKVELIQWIELGETAAYTPALNSYDGKWNNNPPSGATETRF